MKHSILISQKQQDDEIALMQDPIIHGMVREAISMGLTAGDVDNFAGLQAADAAYRQRGGTYEYGHLGAPLRAIVALLEIGAREGWI